MVTFTGKNGVELYTAIVLKHGLSLYAKTGMKPNRDWTPKAMLAKASQITGRTFKRGQYAQAIDALEAWLAQHKVADWLAMNTGEAYDDV